MIIKPRPPGVVAYFSTGEELPWSWELEIEEADVRESTGDNFLTVCTFPSDGVKNDEALLIGEWIGSDGATWIGEAGGIVDVRSIFV